MKPNNKKIFIISGCLLIAFVLFTWLIMQIDVRPIGPQGSSVGFAAINAWARAVLGVNMTLYNITDWASLVALLIAVGFAILGLCQLVQRKSLLRVDGSILALGGFYCVVFCVYLLFEYFVVNRRPVLINGILEASYPSSTTVLVMCIMPTAMMQFRRLIKDKRVRDGVTLLCGAFTGLMVLGRLLSGVHWLTDIFGGALLSAALVTLYAAVVSWLDARKNAV